MAARLPLNLARQLVAEFIGTALLLAAIIGSAIMSANLMGGNSGLELLAQAIVVGAALCVLILIFGPISGAHFNPAVSIAFALNNHLRPNECVLYIIAQIAGGVIGVLIAHLMFEQNAFQLSQTVRSGPGQWLGEFVATFALLAAILGLLRSSPQSIPYAVGLIITAGYWYTSSTTFANPAVTFARMFTANSPGIQPADALAFMVVQVLTAAGSVFLFKWFEQEWTWHLEGLLTVYPQSSVCYKCFVKLSHRHAKNYWQRIGTSLSNAARNEQLVAIVPSMYCPTSEATMFTPASSSERASFWAQAISLPIDQ